MTERVLLEKLRRKDVRSAVGELGKPEDEQALEEWMRSGVKFAASSAKFEQMYDRAVRKLLDCIVPMLGLEPVLHEGGIYLGCWLESTGTINAERLARFVPSVSQRSFRLFSDFQRDDGLMPYKVTEHGPAYRQIQMVTPLARSVWNHYALNGRDRNFLAAMYKAMERQDAWLAAHRNTRGSGGVEAFGTFDTGHDLSPRFWHVPDTPHRGDAGRCDPNSPILPFIAPDLTANVYCQRLYLARMAEELGLGENIAASWREKARQSERSLFEYCYDADDGFFYDLDRNGEHVRVQSDVLLRVLGCEVGDRRFFDTALRRYLLNTRKFFAKYPFPSIAMDDPRFDPFTSYNSWAGPSNFLSLIRTPHAFEHHGRYVELSWVLQPILSAMNRMTRFGQTLSPWTGAEGFTETYSPAILCVLDFVERMSGIMPTPEGELWFTGMTPYPMDHGEEVADETAYARTVDGVVFELVNTSEQSVVYRDGEEHLRFPRGLRAVTDRSGRLTGLIGMTVSPVEGKIVWEGRSYAASVKGNERVELAGGGEFASVHDIGIVYPTYR
ncbi:hypothetical protein ACFFK0_24800 [Paenibacillus chartarius]|uniref:Mannosylglycerate hydrolase MGH1-like glycoside hydrolase domain-containing protein n=1 Tax=Paenibacillus chartarius TaxID=747481 RepID=A0ABV6DSK1_9BACL